MVEHGVCHAVALPFKFKSILRQKKNYGNSNISPCKKYNLPKNPLKETKILQEIRTLELKSQVSTRAKMSCFKNPHIKIDLLLPRGQNPLSCYTL
jgi:hypothetical protein